MAHDEQPLPPVLFPGGSSAERRWLAELKRARRIRSVGPRLYVSVPPKRVAETLRATWSTIVAHLFPRALISHRTALEFNPTPDGEVILTGTSNREVRYPGLALRFVRGPGPLADDPKYLNLRSSSRARAFLENLSSSPARARGRVLPVEELEKRLEQILRVEGEDGLQQLRDRARAIADELGWQSAFDRLDGLVGAMLGTRPYALVSPEGRARAAGEPFDPACLARLQLLVAELRTRPLPVETDPFDAHDHVRNKAFFEAYFSNYIEGTRFEIEEAERIAFDHQVPSRRPKDAHDILGTFLLVSDPVEMRKTPTSYAHLLQLLQSRHATLMEQRPEVEPGTFKRLPNRAGDTHFVEPAYVQGTLRKGMEFYVDLGEGLARAIFLMFLVTDVHPFMDGNGRIARIMMTAELVSAGRSTIIIPTVFRDDYLQALRALTRRHRPGPLVDALVAAQAFSRRSFFPYPTALAELRRRNWFREPDEARLIP